MKPLYGMLPESQEENHEAFFNYLEKGHRKANPVLAELIDEISSSIVDRKTRSRFTKMAWIGLAVMGAHDPYDPDFKKVTCASIEKARASNGTPRMKDMRFIAAMRDARSAIREYNCFFNSTAQEEAVETASLLKLMEICFKAYSLAMPNMAV